MAVQENHWSALNLDLEDKVEVRGGDLMQARVMSYYSEVSDTLTRSGQLGSWRAKR